MLVALMLYPETVRTIAVGRGQSRGMTSSGRRYAVTVKVGGCRILDVKVT